VLLSHTANEQEQKRNENLAWQALSHRSRTIFAMTNHSTRMSIALI